MGNRGSWWYRTVRWVVKSTFFGLLGGLKSVGEHNVPMDGGIILAPNHVSHLDPPATACGTRRALTFMAKEELFKPPIFGPLIRSLGAFPVRRGTGDTEAIKTAIELLKQDRAVLVFPEGTRGDGVSMNAVNLGVSMLAKRTGAKVVPVGIVGSHIALGKGKKLRRHRITVAYGEPITYEGTALEGEGDREHRERFAHILAERIQALCAANGLPLKTAGSSTLRAESPTPEIPTATGDREPV
ncbi:MAG: 1-acyl-sn-glycerol-3-phosphate acyltransferase [Armatimonadetes bacterium]|nr:1-acyl-sn-glycerol-3-phosphate acyltransferase [Armatimonadota bacterium]